ncbi:dual specificity protein kinase splB isoform X1 [Amyelois transitella]|uniref:dual specificity protein kinase splB isoform X1 n=2 Tax=Amyelois transitella TaxID=680683 RepID=UPI00298F3FBC|nr:dual specificity protein kinase splB isoform X1 [Amyelois transitella]
MDSSKEFSCIFCKESFENKEELQIHFRKHGDPNFNQNTKTKAKSDDTNGQKSKEGADMISCDVCTELFPTISKAITHKHKFHPDHDAKYFCPWCGKLFTMKHLYNKHISTSHNNNDQNADEEFPCDCCNVTFHLSSAMLYHNKFFHRQDTDLPSIGQSKKLKMAGQISLMIYYCPFCGQEYNNKVNLHKHMSDDHSDENQSPDDVLRCPLCDAIFYHLDAYEHHLSFHSIDDMYSEKNDMVESVTDFSLEAVPPVMERVENLEPEPNNTPDGDAMGLDDLLLMAMSNPVDEDNPKKSKKHKKHKKSKKAAITLDEFLNMNKDVFGEGIDFQGVEEVPSQVVAKRFKVKNKAASIPKTGTKMSRIELEKLRKQGIVIKMKGSSGKKPIPTRVKQMCKTNVIDLNTQNRSTSVNSSNEVLTKLINQSNNQIKIVRKPAPTLNETNSFDEKPSSPENIEVECDLIQRYTSSETEGEEKSDIKKISKEEISSGIEDDHLEKSSNKVDTANSDNPTFEPNHNSQIGDCNIKNNANQSTPDHDKNKDSNINNSLKSLKNVNQHLTVKPVITSVKTNCNPKHETLTNESFDNTVITKQSEPSEKETSEKGKDKPLNALKHLSHLITIKSVSQTTNDKLLSQIKRRNSFHEHDSLGDSKTNSDEDDSSLASRNELPSPTPEPKQTPVESITAFKKLNSNVTVKAMKSTIQPSQAQMPEFSDEEEKNINPPAKINLNNQHVMRSLSTIPQKIGIDPALSTKGRIKDTNVAAEDRTNIQSNVNLLRKLKNVTAKPINSQNAQINKFKSPMNRNRTETQVGNNEEGNKEIEIYNIDDSDSDNSEDTLPRDTMIKSDVSKNETNNINCNVLKKLSKHLTIKPTNQKSPQINVKSEPDQDEFSDYSQENSEKYAEKCKVTLNKTNEILKNTLKNLSKNVTVKSRNSSPNATVTTQNIKNQDYNGECKDDSENDIRPGQVKITEVDDEYNGPSDNDDFDEDFTDNPIVQSPHDSYSDDDIDFSQKSQEELDDIESKIHANTVSKIETSHNENSKNIGKGITIKSLSEKTSQSHSETVNTTKGNATMPANLSKELSIKPFKHPVKLNPQTTNKINRSTGQIARCKSQLSNQTTSSTDQTNIVNKEVTVKTFQTKTVIQEITTTVTKTIKTVNQSVQQEFHTANQSCTQNVFRKVQGMRPPVQQPTKNYQGVVVRHAAPIMGTKVKNPVTPLRPTRPPATVSNQLVPVRQGTPMNVRPHTPRLPTVRSSAPSNFTKTSTPVKMSPNVVNNSTKKKPVTQEAKGPFSCFKKPKQSLIPVSEFSGVSSGEDDSINFATSTRVNKSNVINMAKTMKGNTIVSSTQMKSEVSSCSQQLSKLNNVTGLKIVKTSQVKQVSQMEEKQDISPTKRNTLEAIEKLQKQGLLVKKPRLEANEESGFSDEDDCEGDGDDPMEEYNDFDDD